MVVKTTIVSKIAECVHNSLLPEVSDVRDESDRSGLRIVVDLKRDADDAIVLNQLYRYTHLQTTFAIANIALVNNRPETLNIKQMLECFIEHRKVIIRRRSQYLLKRCRNRGWSWAVRKPLPACRQNPRNQQTILTQKIV